MTFPEILNVWLSADKSTLLPLEIVKLLFADSQLKLCVEPPPACTFAGVNVNTPALSYVKLPLPLGVAVDYQ